MYNTAVVEMDMPSVSTKQMEVTVHPTDSEFGDESRNSRSGTSFCVFNIFSASEKLAAPIAHL
jgi:hypothetical protein